MKIFEFKPGSYIDPVSGGVSIPANGVTVPSSNTFARTDKGLAWRNESLRWVNLAKSVAEIGLTNKVVVEVWMYPTRYGINSNECKILSANSTTLEIGLENGTEIEIKVNDTRYVSTGADIQLRRWYHCIFVYDGSDGLAEIYLDGVRLYQNTSAVVETLDAGVDVIIGNRVTSSGVSDLSDFYFRGDIGRIQIYDHILTPKERAKLYKEFLDASPTTRAVEDNLDYPALKPHDLSHLVDARVGNPDADITTKNVSALENEGGASGYTEFTAIGTTGFTVVSDGGALHLAGTADEIEFVAGKKYIVEFDLVLNSGNLPGFSRITSQLGGTNWGAETDTPAAGHNAMIFSCTTSGTGTWQIYNSSTVTNYTLSNYSIKEWNGEELVPDEDVGFVANRAGKWVAYGGNDKEQDGNAVKVTYDDNIASAYLFFQASTGVLFSDTVAGQKYTITYRAKVNIGSSVTVRFHDGGTNEEIQRVTNTSYVTYEYTFTRGAGHPYISGYYMTTGESIWIEIISLMKVTGLVAAYNMIPSPESVLVDISGEGNDATIVGAVSDVGGMKFNGTSDYINISGFTGILTKTLIVRFNQNNIRSNAMILGDSSAYFLFMLSATVVRYRSNSVVHDFTIPEYTWGEDADIVLTTEYTGTDLITKVFFNGIESSSGALLQGTTGDYRFDYIGYGGFASSYFPGQISDVKFFNYAFSEQEAKLYHQQFAKEIQLAIQ